VYVCLFARIYFRNHTRDLAKQFFVDVAYGRGSVLLRQDDEIPREGTILGVFFPTDNALYSIAFGTHTKTELIEMPFGMMSGLDSLGPRTSVLLCYVG